MAKRAFDKEVERLRPGSSTATLCVEGEALPAGKPRKPLHALLAQHVLG